MTDWQIFGTIYLAVAAAEVVVLSAIYVKPRWLFDAETWLNALLWPFQLIFVVGWLWSLRAR